MKFLHISVIGVIKETLCIKKIHLGFHHGVVLGSLSFFPSNWQVKGPDVLGDSLGTGKGTLRLLS